MTSTSACSGSRASRRRCCSTARFRSTTCTTATSSVDASTLLTAFPYRQAGWMGKRGTNQAKQLNLSIPPDALGYWVDRLSGAGIDAQRLELFGTERLAFSHPCGISYALVADPGPDDRAPLRGGECPGRVRHPRRLWHHHLGAGGRRDGFLHQDRDAGGVGWLGGSRPPVPDRRRGRLRPDLGVGRGAGSAAGHMAFRRGHDPPPSVRCDLRGEPTGRQGLDRRTRVHRRLRSQGPRLLLLLLLPQPRRAAGASSPIPPGRAS